MNRLMRKYIFIFVVIIAACLITDTGIRKTTDLVSKKNIWQMPIFMMISVGFIISQYLLLIFIGRKGAQMKGSKHRELNIIWKIVFVTQIALTVIRLILIFQLLVSHRYNIMLLNVSTIISYQLAITMTGILAQQFFTWYTSRKNLLVLIYGLAAAVITLSSIISLAYIIIGLSSRPAEVGPQAPPANNECFTGRLLSVRSCGHRFQ